MTVIAGIAVGLLAIGLLRLYGGSRIEAYLTKIAAAGAFVAMAVWIVSSRSVEVALPVAAGFLLAIAAREAPKSIKQLPKSAQAFFGAWGTMLTYFVVASVVR
jgi:hypothetical protein